MASKTISTSKSNRSLDAYSESRALTNDQIDSFAMFHNSSCTTVLGTMNWSATPLVTEADNRFLSLWGSWMPLSEENYSSTLLASTGVLDSTRIDTIFGNTTAFYSTYYYLLALVNDTNNSYTEIESAINVRKTEAESQLSGTDIDQTLLFLETSKRSAYFWLPTTRGGSGTGYAYLQTYCINNSIDPSILQVKMGELIATDGLSMVYGWLVVALIAAPTPVTIGAIAAIVGLEAARASVLYIIVATMY